MISFKEFLTEGRSAQISEEQLISILRKNCREFLSLKKHPIIYRGVSGSGNIKLVKPSKFTRKSKSDAHGNVYTVLMDSLDSWSEYPKRSKSIICSSDYYTSDGYAPAHLVIPFDGAKWGVCPAEDIFDSFSELYNYLDIELRELGRNFSYMHSLLKKYKSTSISGSRDVQYPEDYKIILKFLKEVDAFILKYLDLINKKGSSSDLDENFSTLVDDIYDSGMLRDLVDIRKKRNTNIGQIFNEIMSPTKNGFKLLTTPKLASINSYDREVWTDSDSVLILLDGKENDVLKNVFNILNIKKTIDKEDITPDERAPIFLLKHLSKVIL